MLFCQFCGSKLLIDDESRNVHFDDPAKAGYEFEQGRIAAQKEERRKAREKEEQIARAKRVMEENHRRQTAVAEQERRKRNAGYTIRGWLLFLAIVVILCVVPGNAVVKGFIGFFSGCIIWGIQSSRCKQDYVHEYTYHADTDDEGNIIHVDRL